MLGPVLDLGPGLLGLPLDREPWAGSLRLDPRLKEAEPPPDDFPGLELTTSWLVLVSQLGGCLGSEEDFDVMLMSWQTGGEHWVAGVTDSSTSTYSSCRSEGDCR